MKKPIAKKKPNNSVGHQRKNKRRTVRVTEVENKLQDLKETSTKKAINPAFPKSGLSNKGRDFCTLTLLLILTN